MIGWNATATVAIWSMAICRIGRFVQKRYSGAARGAEEQRFSAARGVPVEERPFRAA
jgi:hypothetical protein